MVTNGCTVSIGHTSITKPKNKNRFAIDLKQKHLSIYYGKTKNFILKKEFTKHDIQNVRQAWQNMTSKTSNRLDKKLMLRSTIEDGQDIFKNPEVNLM